MSGTSKSQFQNQEWLANNSLLGMIPANQDLTDATYQYYGFLNPGGTSWIIQRFHIISSAIIYEYAKGNTILSYTANWNASTGLYQGSLTFLSYDLLP